MTTTGKKWHVELDCLETLAKICIVSARQNQFIREIIFNNAPDRQTATVMNANSSFARSYTANFFWYQQIQLRQIKNSEEVNQS